MDLKFLDGVIFGMILTIAFVISPISRYRGINGHGQTLWVEYKGKVWDLVERK